MRRRNEASERVRSSSPPVAVAIVSRPRLRLPPGARGVFGGVMIRVGMPGRRMMRLPSASSSAWTGRPGARSPVAAGRAAAGSAADGAGRAMWFRLCGRRASPGGRARTGRAAGRQGLLAEAASGLVLGAALALVLLVAALLLLALARLGGGALAGVAGLALGAALRFLLGVAAILLLADAGVGEGVGARIALLVGQRAQHHAGRARRRRRCGLRLRRGSARRRRAHAAPAAAAAAAAFGASFPSAGPTRRFFVSTTTDFVRPCEKLCRTVFCSDGRFSVSFGDARWSVFSPGALVSVSLIPLIFLRTRRPHLVSS